MSRLKLKGMKLVMSESAINNADGCEASVDARINNNSNSNPPALVNSNRSAPLPDVAPHGSISSSSADSNHNEDTRLENIQAISEGVNLNTVDGNGRPKKRGRTTLKELWTLTPEEKILVSSNNLGQPIGPEAQLLAGFLGMLGSGQQIGLHYESWHKVPKTLKEELFKFIELRFALEIPREYALKSLGKKWRDYKHDLKKRHFKREDGLQANKNKHPHATIRWQWEQLVDFWYSRKGEDSEKVGISSRKQQKYTHTSGSKSFVRKEKEMEKANEKLAEYQGMDDDMQLVETEILTQVIGKERCGRVRGVGLGPTPKSFYGCATSRKCTTSSAQSVEFVERFHQMEQRMQQMQEEREHERAQRDKERTEREQERAQYNALLSFLQNQFPRVNIPGVNIDGSNSQS